MLNEGIIVNDTAALLKSEIVRQIHRLGPTLPDQLERAVFRALTGHDREEVDWDVQDNQAGYFSWLKSFDQMVKELVEDGYILEEGEPPRLVPSELDPHGEYSHLVYPPRQPG
jgi:hypothetical protein